MRRMLALSLWMIALFAVLSVALFLAALHTYDRLTAESLIAELRFDRAGERQYTARVRGGDRCSERTFVVLGDQFRIDAEFVKWKYWALLFGLDSQYRLDRLEGRYSAVSDQNTQPSLAHDLRERTAIDVVALTRALGPWNFLLDAAYGSSTYQDIDVGRVYSIYRTTTGIITRSAERQADLAPGGSFTVTVTDACRPPSRLWRALAAVDGVAVATLDLLTE